MAQDKPFWELQTRWPFFPAYPMVVAGFIRLTSLSSELSAFLVNFVFSIGAFIVFYKFLILTSRSAYTAFWCTVLMLILPFHYFISMMQTEPMFLFFSILLFYSIEKNNLWLLIFCLFVVPLIRSNGICVSFAGFLYFLEKRDILTPWKINLKNLTQKTILHAMLFSISVVALCLFSWYAYTQTGDFFAYKTAQLGWNRHFCWPWQSLYAESSAQIILNSTYALFFIGLGIWGFRKYPIGLMFLVAINILLPLSAGSAISMPRFISTIFPYSILIGEKTQFFKYKKLLIILLLLLHSVSYYFWIIGSNISY